MAGHRRQPNSKKAQLLPMVAFGALIAALLSAQPDAAAQSDASVETCDGRVPTLVGSDGNDVLLGTDDRDVIVGLGGNDIIIGFGGRDVVCGGAGRDRLVGGDDRDLLKGQAGHDELFGDRSNDRLIGGSGNDRLFGGSGNDRLFGGRGDDFLIGGRGIVDRLVGNGGIDECIDHQPRTIFRSCELPAAEPEPAFADFNGDGFSDLAIGVEGEDIGSAFGAGAVNVVYGSASGVSPTTALPDQLWHQDSPGIEGIAETRDRFGAGLTSADFNGDGLSDLAIAVPGDNGGLGGVNLIYGSSTGLSATEGHVDQHWPLSSIEAVMTAADFNGDGFADLAVGSSGGGGMLTNVGFVEVVYGSNDGLSTDSLPPQRWHQWVPGIDGLPTRGDGFGNALAAADFNGDGFGDLAVGEPGDGVGEMFGTGAVHVIYGSSHALSATAVIAAQLWTQNSPGIGGAASFDRFGEALTAGDFNGDGFGDLASGAPGEEVPRLADDGSGTLVFVVNAGAVNVIYGSSSGLSATGEIDDQLWTRDSPDIEDEAKELNNFGSVLTAADFNGDGFTDLAAGMPGEHVGPLLFAGVVSVIHGSSSGLSATVVPDQAWTQDSPGVDGDVEQFDHFGQALSAGDFDANGADDLVIATDNGDLVAVIYGSNPSGLSATAAIADQLWNQDSPDVEGEFNPRDLPLVPIARTSVRVEGR